MFRFNEGDVVLLNSNEYASLDLQAGAEGTVWATYHDGQFTAYEVTFRDAAGNDFDMTCDEDELTASQPQTVRAVQAVG